MHSADGSNDALRRLVSDHRRAWHGFDYVYPVVSRRSGGLSIGINLNIDAACNFDCVYCQVERPTGRRGDVDGEQLRHELSTMIQTVVSGEIWSDPAFAATPLAMRRLNDIAFSGDGEPTAHPAFAEACETAADLRQRFGLTTARIVLITNATLLHRPAVMRCLAHLDGNGGEVWAKLDAGSEAYFKAVDRPRGGITLGGIVANIAAAARRRPIVVQSMWMRMDGKAPGDDEFEAYLDRLASIVESGGVIDRVQLYTVARQPAESFVGPLSKAELEGFATALRGRLGDVRCDTFPAKG